MSNVKITRLISKKRKHIKNWKRHGRVTDRINANKLNKESRQSMHEEQKQQIRRKIKPGVHSPEISPNNIDRFQTDICHDK